MMPLSRGQTSANQSFFRSGAAFLFCWHGIG